MPPWFEDLGVDSFGEILGKVNVEDLQSSAPPKSPLSSMAMGKEEGKEVASIDGEGNISVGDAVNRIKHEDGEERISSSSEVSADSPFTSDEPQAVQHDGEDVWESISLGNSTEHAAQKPNKVEPASERISGIPYPAEEPNNIHDSELLRSHQDVVTEQHPFVDEKTLVPPVEKLIEEGEIPKARNIPLWKPHANRAAPPPIYILPEDNPVRILSTNIDTFKPMVATSTYTTKVSGQLVTSTTISTIDQRALKFKSCIYGCPEMTSSDPLVGTTTIITVLPFIIPCSLVSCPPCPACFQSTISVSVCPFITTVPGKAKTAIVNGPTITVIRSTVTRTKCTATRTISYTTTITSCTPETLTVTVKEEIIRHHTQGSSEHMDAFSDDNSSGRSPLVDPRMVLGSSSDVHSDQSRIDQMAQIEGDALKKAHQLLTTTETIMSTVYATPSKKLPSLTITKTVYSDRVMVTVTSTVLPVTTVESTTPGVCSTFIICNPSQFTCPAQVTNLAQIKAVVQNIMDGQEKFGSGGVGSRKISPNGANIDVNGPDSLYGDGLQFVGGLSPVNGFGFGPGGMFQKVLGPELIPEKEKTSDVTLLPPSPTTSTSASQAKMIMAAQQETPVSTTRIIEVEPTASGKERRTVIKRSRKQNSGSSINHAVLPIASSIAIAISYLFYLL